MGTHKQHSQRGIALVAMTFILFLLVLSVLSTGMVFVGQTQDASATVMDTSVHLETAGLPHAFVDHLSAHANTHGGLQAALEDLNGGTLNPSFEGQMVFNGQTFPLSVEYACDHLGLPFAICKSDTAYLDISGKRVDSSGSTAAYAGYEMQLFRAPEAARYAIFNSGNDAQYLPMSNSTVKGDIYNLGSVAARPYNDGDTYGPGDLDPDPTFPNLKDVTVDSVVYPSERHYRMWVYDQYIQYISDNYQTAVDACNSNLGSDVWYVLQQDVDFATAQPLPPANFTFVPPLPGTPFGAWVLTSHCSIDLVPPGTVRNITGNAVVVALGSIRLTRENASELYLASGENVNHGVNGLHLVAGQGFAGSNYRLANPMNAIVDMDGTLPTTANQNIVLYAKGNDNFDVNPNKSRLNGLNCSLGASGTECGLRMNGVEILLRKRILLLYETKPLTPQLQNVTIYTDGGGSAAGLGVDIDIRNVGISRALLLANGLIKLTNGTDIRGLVWQGAEAPGGLTLTDSTVSGSVIVRRFEDVDGDGVPESNNFGVNHSYYDLMNLADSLEDTFQTNSVFMVPKTWKWNSLNSE